MCHECPRKCAHFASIVSSRPSPHYAGVIREIAEHQVGGADRLEAALRRGACRSVTHKGVELFFFPSMAVGQTEESRVAMSTGRSKATTTQAYDAIAELAVSMGWSLSNLSAGSLEADLFFSFGFLCHDLVYAWFRVEKKRATTVRRPRRMCRMICWIG